MNSENTFLKDILKDLLKDFKNSLREFKELKTVVSGLLDLVRNRPCVKGAADAAILSLAEYYTEQGKDCKACTVKILEKQIAFKNKIIFYQATVIAGMAIGTAVAGGWWLWIR